MGGYFSAGPGEVRITAAIHDGSTPSSPPFAQTSLSQSGSGFADSGYNPPKSFTFTARSTLVLTETSAQSGYAGLAIDNVSVKKVGN